MRCWYVTIMGLYCIAVQILTDDLLCPSPAYYYYYYYNFERIFCGVTHHAWPSDPTGTGSELCTVIRHTDTDPQSFQSDTDMFCLNVSAIKALFDLTPRTEGKILAKDPEHSQIIFIIENI